MLHPSPSPLYSVSAKNGSRHAQTYYVKYVFAAILAWSSDEGGGGVIADGTRSVARANGNKPMQTLMSPGLSARTPVDRLVMIR